ncbi:hypothetical protein OHU45_03545 [Streptomyces tubercidicus]|uniref:hypothetical protein n=1 Tax=Streptomyces tubercidicus TaxID=47759 RepID=UPI002E109C0E|nr:hypothetical protein OG761_03365 [Streptomyces tubercidicus]WSX24327.1 hypothetical protein OG690_33970 [Streptomyces tubercidicus]
MADYMAADLSGMAHGAGQTDELSRITGGILTQAKEASRLSDAACGYGDDTADQLRKTLVPAADACEELLTNLSVAFQQTAEQTLGTQKSLANAEDLNLAETQRMKHRMR